MTFRPLILTALLFGTGLAQAQTDSFTLPADLTQSPFNCKLNGSAYDCPAISLDKDTTLTLTAPVTMNVSGGFDADKLFTTVNNGNKLTMTVSGPVDFRKDLTAQIDLTVAGPLNFAKDAHFTGNITTAGNLTVAKDSWIDGNVVISGNLDMGNNSYITGTCSVTGTTNYTCTGATPPPTSMHHVRLDHNGSGLTCTPSTITVRACSAADINGSCPASTAGISGSVVASYGASSITVPYSIAPNASSTTVSVGVTTPGTATLSATGASAFTCWNGNAASCAHVFSDFGIQFDIPNQRSNAVTPVDVLAIKTDTKTAACVPAFTNVTKQVNFTCAYITPSTSRASLTIKDTTTTSSATLACPASSDVSLAFGSNGKAQVTVQYPEAGKVSVTGTLSGYSVTDSFIAVPNAFTITPSGTSFVAGVQFNTQVTAINTAGNVTANYTAPDASATISFARCQPEADGKVDGTFTYTLAAFSGGSATLTGNWSEVGIIDIAALDSDYLDTQLPITGNTSGSAAPCPGGKGKIGPFRPHHFLTDITRKEFTYSGQPIPVTVKALNAQGNVTENYFDVASGGTSQGFAKKVTLSTIPASAGGTLTANEITADKFTNGIAKASPTFTFTDMFTAPIDITLHAKDADGVESLPASEDKTNIRTGRLRLSNVFGSARQSAKMPVRAEYWTGKSWLLNSADTDADATSIYKLSVALTPRDTDSKVNSNDFTLVNGQGFIELGVPTKPVNYVDVAINLGDATSTADVSCLADHPGTTSAKEPWLRSQYGNCGSAADPSARASFGIYKPETKRTIHIQERFN